MNELSHGGRALRSQLRCMVTFVTCGLLLGLGSLGPGCGAVVHQVPQANLPMAVAVNTSEFAGVQVCTRCHSANITTMRDAKGRDISPIGEWQVSMMGLAARDPYFLAALAREQRTRPTQRAEIDDLCLRCHAPVGHAAAGLAGQRLALTDLLHNPAPYAELAREGVTCVACHAARPDGLGQPASFNGRLTLRTDRVVFGLLVAPMIAAMEQMIQMRAERGAHMGRSALCGSCHTVVVPGVAGGEILEQGTYLEWRASGFSTEQVAPSAYAAECQQCHMSTLDQDGQPFSTAMSTRPITAPIRSPYARHALVGGSAYLLERLAPFATWLGAGVTSADLQRAAVRSTALLQTAAQLSIVAEQTAPARNAAPNRAIDVAIRVDNLTGHKLPTGYPSRRMWLHVQALDRGGRVVFESGAHRQGQIVGIDEHRETIVPDMARLTASGPPSIWQAVPVGADARVTHLQLGVAKFAKDNRILPKGWRSADADPRLAPIGVAKLAQHQAGAATVLVALPPTTILVKAELLYQAIPPATIASYDRASDALAAQFRIITAAPPEPTVMAKATLQLALRDSVQASR